jgi:hypothetical protein
MTWQVHDEVLQGEITFHQHEAILTAFGYEGSKLVQSPTEIHYDWEFKAQSLVLHPRGKNITLTYEIIDNEGEQRSFRCFDDILINLER